MIILPGARGKQIVTKHSSIRLAIAQKTRKGNYGACELATKTKASLASISRHRAGLHWYQWSTRRSPQFVQPPPAPRLGRRYSQRQAIQNSHAVGAGDSVGNASAGPSDDTLVSLGHQRPAPVQ